MISKPSVLLRRFEQLIRYYSVGIINSAVGYGLYAGIVTVVLNIYIAQLMSHIMGVIFNYFMLKTHVFRGTDPNKINYVMAYIVNYLLGLVSLIILHRFVKSVYLVGVLSLVTVSIINYFILKRFVFRLPHEEIEQPEGPGTDPRA